MQYISNNIILQTLSNKHRSPFKWAQITQCTQNKFTIRRLIIQFGISYQIYLFAVA